jgi:hypothetical protein
MQRIVENDAQAQVGETDDADPNEDGGSDAAPEATP